MEDMVGKYYLLDGVVNDISNKIKVDSDKGRAAYEVIRIIRRVPLFFQDHYHRLEQTFKEINLQLELRSAVMMEYIEKLINANMTDNCNVKIVVFNEGDKQRNLTYISSSYYPTVKEVSEGVKTGLLHIERQNPNAKLINQSYKNAVSAKINEGKYFEAVLVDSLGRVTEGSKSNIFFVKGNEIYTAPGESVLMGITRKYVFEACQNAGYKVNEEFVKAKELMEYDGAFLSGTSIKVLPIKSIDAIAMHSSPNYVIDAIRSEYDSLLEKYIDQYRK